MIMGIVPSAIAVVMKMRQNACGAHAVTKAVVIILVHIEMNQIIITNTKNMSDTSGMMMINIFRTAC